MLTCTECKKAIIGGFFSTLIAGEEMRFHDFCRPFFFYEPNKDKNQLPLFKEKK